MMASGFPLCYCGDGSENKEDVSRLPWERETLQCRDCKANIHVKCLKAPTPSTLTNDYLYELTCARCTPAGEDENYARPSKIPSICVVALILHHLQSTQEGKHGYFHYKKDITSLCLQHQSHLLPKNQAKGSTPGVSTTLSTYGCHFINGSQELGVSGWWRLRINQPPFLSKTYPKEAALVSTANLQPTRSGTRASKKKVFSDFVVEPVVKKGKGKMVDRKSNYRPVANSQLLVAGEGNQPDISGQEAVRESLNRARKMAKLTKLIPVPARHSTLPVADTSVTMETECIASDSNLQSEAVQLTDLNPESLDIDAADEDALARFQMDVSPDEDFQPSLDLQIDTSALVEELPSMMEETAEASDMINSEPVVKYPSYLSDVKQEPVESTNSSQHSDAADKLTPAEDGSMSESKPTPPGGNSVPSLDHSAQPIAEEKKDEEKVVEHSTNHSRDWSAYKEGKLLAILDSRAKCSKEISPQERLLRRLAIVRKMKRAQGMPIFNINTYLNAPQLPLKQISTNSAIGPGLSAPLVSSVCTNRQTLDRYQNESTELSTGSFVPFINKLKGGAVQLSSTRSCYTARILKPYIWQDLETRPPKLKILNEIRRRSGEELGSDSIDYKYVTADHIPVINKICHQAFWPSIDLSECLQYSDFSCVTMYKKLIIGFAFMVPDVSHNEAYISFIYTHPDWRGAGIASVMLYHLIQTCMGKDVTLHVSMTNPAIGLYFKFGFQVVEIIHNFYDKYHPIDSTQSPHAFYMKLDRY